MIIRLENKSKIKVSIEVSIVYVPCVLEPYSAGYVEPHNSNTSDKIGTIVIKVSDFND